MSFTLDSTYLIVAGIALLIGLLFGIAFGGGARARAKALAEKVRKLELDIDVREAERVRLQRELASSTDQVRPLSDEVDRLRRERDQRKAAITAAPVADTPVAAPPVDEPVLVSRETDLAPPAAVAGSDSLTLLKGVGDRFAAKLNEIGVTGYRQIAAWTPEQAVDADVRLGSFQGRIVRDRLVEQAQLLSQGRTTEYEARFGKLGG